MNCAHCQVERITSHRRGRHHTFFDQYLSKPDHLRIHIQSR